MIYLKYGAGSFAAAFVILIILSYVATMVRPDQGPIRDHIREDMQGVVSARTAGDVHTECLLLSSVIAPDPHSRQYILDPMMLVSADPCVGLTDALSGKDDLDWVSYSRYWMGATYLDVIALDLFKLSDVHALYMSLLAASIIVFGASGVWGLGRGLWAPLFVTAIGIFAGVGIVKFGGHVGHSPVFFLTMFALAAIIAFGFKSVGRREAVLIGSLIGVISGYYDILSGAIPFTVALLIFVYYLLWRNSPPPVEMSNL